MSTWVLCSGNPIKRSLHLWLQVQVPPSRLCNESNWFFGPYDYVTLSDRSPLRSFKLLSFPPVIHFRARHTMQWSPMSAVGFAFRTTESELLFDHPFRDDDSLRLALALPYIISTVVNSHATLPMPVTSLFKFTQCSLRYLCWFFNGSQSNEASSDRSIPIQGQGARCLVSVLF